MRVLINRRVVEGPWGGGNQFVYAFRTIMTRLGYEIVDRLDALPDAILLVGIEQDSMGVGLNEATSHVIAHPSCRLISRLNDCDARKCTVGVDYNLAVTASFCDSLVFVSEWLKDHLLSQWQRDGITDTTNKKVFVVHNGVDHNVFAPIVHERSKPIRVVAHHWSDNPMKGRDVYEALDRADNIKLTYIGRHACRFVNKDTVVIPPITGHELATALAEQDVYVSGSLWDPGPNHVLESLACGLPTWVHKNGGGCVEFAGTDHTYDTIDELIAIMTGSRVCTRNTYMPMNWDQCIVKYANVINEVCRS